MDARRNGRGGCTDNLLRLIFDNNTQDSVPKCDHSGEQMTSFSRSRGTSIARFRVLWTVLAFFIPISIASAGVLSFIENMVGAGSKAFSRITTSQNTPLLSAVGGPDSDYTPSHELSIVSDDALLADTGPLGTMLDIEEEASKGMISTYMVREGDSLSNIAQMFGVSVNTILWANGLTRTTPLKVGAELVILPVSGVRHTVKKNDTLASIAKNYKADADDISDFNALSEGVSLEIGSIIVVPNGQIAETKKSPAPRVTSRLRGATGPAYDGYYIKPVDGRKTQGLHGYNGVDLGASIGTPVFASAGGQVIVARGFGYNGGYGKYVVISHDNGTQTLYGHLNSVNVGVGETVGQGQFIGEVGNTGRSTGPHLHFEIRGARNPF
jgi:LysM repeat protein